MNSDLTPKAILDLLAGDDPSVADKDGCVNLEQEVNNPPTT